jgi:hypothetical protein
MQAENSYSLDAALEKWFNGLDVDRNGTFLTHFRAHL